MNVAKEIYKTEEVYVRNMGILVEVFLEPLQKMLSDKKKDPMVYFNSLYSDISVIAKNLWQSIHSHSHSLHQVIRGFNSTLLSDLKPIVNNWSEEQCIGDVFVKAVSNTFVFFSYLLILSSPSLSPFSL